MRTRLLLGVALLALLLPGTAIAYTPLTNDDGDEIEPNPGIRGNVTIGSHTAECDTDPLCYMDDSNDVANLADDGFALDTAHVDEPIQLKPQSVDCQYYGEDSDKKSTVSGWCANVSDVSWLDTAKWTAANDGGGDVFERAQRNGAHALHIKNVGATTDESDTYTLDFTDITTDPAKLRLIIGMEIISMGSDVYVHAHDTVVANTEKFRYARTGGTADGLSDQLGNGTGITFWDEIITEGAATGTGMTTGVGKLVLELYADSDVAATEIYVYALAVQVKRFQLGVDELGDPVYNMTYTDCDGVARSTPLGYACLAEFDAGFTYQEVNDLKVAYELKASALPDDQVNIIAAENDDDTYPWKTNYEFGFLLPKEIDLTYAGDEKIYYELPVAGGQHDVVTSAGVDKSKDVEKKKVGDEVTLASAVTSGKEHEIEMTVLFTDVQMADVSEGTALGIFAEGGFLYSIWAKLAGLAVVGVVFAKAMSRRRRA